MYLSLKKPAQLLPSHLKCFHGITGNCVSMNTFVPALGKNCFRQLSKFPQENILLPRSYLPTKLSERSYHAGKRKPMQPVQEKNIQSLQMAQRHSSTQITNNQDLSHSTPSSTELEVIHGDQLNLTFPCFHIHKGSVEDISYTSVERKFLKNTLNLKTRDLQVLVSNLNYPTILPRFSCIIVDVKNVQCIIMADQVFIFDKLPSTLRIIPDFIYEEKDAGSLAEFISKDLSHYENDQPFEFSVLESVLRYILTDAEELYVKFQVTLEKILNDPSLAPSEERLHDMLLMKQSMNRFVTHLSELHQCLESLLGTDEDMAQMYLAVKQAGKIRNPQDHEEVELLLEAYYSQTEDVMNRVKELIHDIQSTQDFLNVCLDSQRNRMIRLELKLIMATFVLSMGTLIAGLFGMNLTTGLENDANAFLWVVGGIISGCIISLSVFYAVASKRGLFESIVYFLKIRKRRLNSFRR